MSIDLWPDWSIILKMDAPLAAEVRKAAPFQSPRVFSSRYGARCNVLLLSSVPQFYREQPFLPMKKELVIEAEISLTFT